MTTCSSCNKKVEDYIKFKCPSCGEPLIRCNHCRALSVSFKCKKCGQNLP